MSSKVTEYKCTGVLLGKMLLHLSTLYNYSHTNANKKPNNYAFCIESDSDLSWLLGYLIVSLVRVEGKRDASVKQSINTHPTQVADYRFLYHLDTLFSQGLF